MLQLALVVRHDLLNELLRLFEGRFVVNQDFANFVGQVITQCTNDRIAFAVKEKRRWSLDNDQFDGFPDR